MKIPFRWENDWRVYREELKEFRGKHNFVNFRILSVLLFLTCGVFFYQNLYFPTPVKFPWLRGAYTVLHSCGVAIALCIALFFSIAQKFKQATASRLVNCGAVFFSVAIVSLGIVYTVFDYITFKSITAAFVASMGISTMLSSVVWAYALVQAWGFVLFLILYRIFLADIASPGTLITMAFVAAISFFFGLYMQYARVRMQVLSLKLEERNRELKAIMIRDPLTGAYNRLFLEEFLQKQVTSFNRYGDYTSILMFDIDRFKSVNDTFGHQRGDAVLKRLVEIVTQNIRDSDIVARIGGEEFLVLLPRTNGENALRIAEKLRGIVAESAFEEIPRPITISIGVGNLSDGESLDAALARIDEALYAAKRKGRNRVEGSSAMSGAFHRKA